MVSTKLKKRGKGAAARTERIKDIIKVVRGLKTDSAASNKALEKIRTLTKTNAVLTIRQDDHRVRPG